MSVFNVRATGSPGSLSPQKIDEAEVRRALELLADPEAVCQVFGIPGFQHANRKGNDLDGLVSAVKELASSNGIYLVLNPLSGRLPIVEGVSSGKRLTAGDVLYRRWLFLDIDPIKPPSHKDDPATDEEHELTRQAAEEIRDYLVEQGLPAPVMIDSGNGWYLLWRTYLSVSAHSQAIIRKWTIALAERIRDKAKIDKSVHDAPRLAKIPGTQSRKGVPSDARPWRMCRLVYAPPELEIVSAEMIIEATPAADTNGHAPAKKSVFVLKAGTDRANAYVSKALDCECSRVASARGGPDDGRNNALNRAAFALGRLVGGSYLDRFTVERRLREVARDCGLHEDPGCGERGIEATIRSGIEAGIAEPRTIEVSQPSTPAAESSLPDEEQSADAWQLCLDEHVLESGDAESITAPLDDLADESGTSTFQIFSLPTLMATTFPPPSWVVPGLLSEGLNLLAGKPKMGKSILALNLAMTISGGGLALGNTAVEQGHVLYLALEDKFRRIQTRARKMAQAAGQSVSGRLHLVTDWPRIHLGGLNLLDAWIKSVQTPRLIIIDVWPMFKPAAKVGRSAYDEDYAAFGLLKKFCDRRGVNCLALMHCRKGQSEDVLEEVSGTLGQVGAADGILVLSRSRKDGEAKVFVCGRDVDEQELSLSFELPTLTWKSLGPASEHVQGKLQIAVLDYLKTHPPSFVKDIAIAVNASPESVRTVLGRLLEKYIVRREGNCWAWPGDQHPDEGAI